MLAGTGPFMTADAWSALVTGFGGVLALMIFWVDARLPGFSGLSVSSVPAPRDRGTGTGENRP
jgi:hypothetical protein